MSYGRSMKDWEAREDERLESIWKSALTSAIETHNKPLAVELMKKGLINDYRFPDFPAGTWYRDELESLKRSNY